MNIEISDDFRHKLLIAYGAAALLGGIIAIYVYTKTDTQAFAATVSGEEHGGKKARECIGRSFARCMWAADSFDAGYGSKFVGGSANSISCSFSVKGKLGTVRMHLMASEVRDNSTLEWTGMWKVEVSADNQIMFDKAVALLREKIPPPQPTASATQPADIGAGLAN